MKKNIIWILCVVVLIVFLALNAKVIDKGTEGQYTGVVAFDASSSSSDDWSGILAEITANAEDIKDVDLRNLGAGKAVKLTGTVSEFVSKANGKKNSITVVPNNSTSGEVISIQLGSVYTGTSVRDIQTVKAINSQIHELVVEPLNIDESIQGKTVTVIGAATSSGDEVTVTPVSITIE